MTSKPPSTTIPTTARCLDCGTNWKLHPTASTIPLNCPYCAAAFTAHYLSSALIELTARVN